MANNAYYEMKVVGRQDNVEAFVRAMIWEDEYEQQGAGRVFSCEVYEQGESNNGYYVLLSGDCAWSIQSAMRVANNPNNIEKLSKKLELSIEAYCEEGGFEFQEHFLVVNGEVEIDECIDWSEIDVEDIDEIEDDFWQQDWVVASGITKENAKEHAVDGYVSIGGYESWDIQI